MFSNSLVEQIDGKSYNEGKPGIARERVDFALSEIVSGVTLRLAFQ